MGQSFAGPLWDFNLGFGNANYCQGGDTTGWELNFNSYCGGGWQNPFWWNRLLEDSLYAHDVNCRWQSLRQNVLSTPVLMNYIDSVANVLTEPAARNYTRWPILGVYVWPNNFIGDTFQEEIDYLKEWVTGRLTWMDNNMFGSCTDLGLNENSLPTDINIYPNPASTSVTVKSEQPIPNASIDFITTDGRCFKKMHTNELNTFAIDIRDLEEGIYFVRVYANNEFYTTFKLIKK
ncbi:MAG: CotH kinase family protein [Cryomorphaceae bacterium]|nr:CotH kinase family protein [Cryomorphaceae bacterium]